jgi:hypothetical protein
VALLAATLIALPILFFYHQPSVNQILCDISTRIAANSSDNQASSFLLSRYCNCNL